MNPLRRFLRAMCWMLRHDPDDNGVINEHGTGILKMHEYRCRRCGADYWQWGSTGLVQVHADDPRAVRLFR